MRARKTSYNQRTSDEPNGTDVNEMTGFPTDEQILTLDPTEIRDQIFRLMDAYTQTTGTDIRISFKHKPKE